MASFNTVIFLSLLVAVSAFMAAPSTVEAGVREVENVINVTGKVPCAYNTTILRNGSLAGPRFPSKYLRKDISRIIFSERHK